MALSIPDEIVAFQTPCSPAVWGNVDFTLLLDKVGKQLVPEDAPAFYCPFIRPKVPPYGEINLIPHPSVNVHRTSIIELRARPVIAEHATIPLDLDR